MFRTLFTAGTLLAAATAFAQLTSDYIRTKDGALVRAGDPKTQVVDKLGFPFRRQGETYYYRVRDTLYQVKFKGDTVHWITRSSK